VKSKGLKGAGDSRTENKRKQRDAGMNGVPKKLKVNESNALPSKGKMCDENNGVSYAFPFILCLWNDSSLLF
jgi:hypothetical protein